jgi:hypothetical protein
MKLHTDPTKITSTGVKKLETTPIYGLVVACDESKLKHIFLMVFCINYIRIFVFYRAFVHLSILVSPGSLKHEER